MHRPVRHSPDRVTAPDFPAGRWLSRGAFFLSLVLVLSRALMNDTLRPVMDATAGPVAAPLTPGPGTGLALDLLCVVPALLLLLRRARDRAYRPATSWVFWPMLGLGACALFSFLWASDKFAAVVSASHFAAAMVFVWSTAQLVRGWGRLRWVCGAGVGALLALLTVGYGYRLLEFSDLQREWNENRAEVLRGNHITPNTPEAIQFEKRLTGGEPMAFSASTNSYAAILVLLVTVSAGVAIQRWADGNARAGAGLAWLAAAASLPVIHWTRCRAAHATPVVGAMLFVGVWLLRPHLRRFARPIYALTVVAVALVAAVVIHHGVRHGSLWHDSLNFRWTYWVGSFGIFTEGLTHHRLGQFLLGVGWENFGSHYLGHRLQVAAEEIRDPHNFIVRVFVELGLVGGVLLLVWLLKLAWELTRPAEPPAEAMAIDEGGAPLLKIGALATAVALLNVALSIDLDAGWAFVLIEVVRRVFFLVAIFAGLAAAVLVTVRREDEEKSFRFSLDVRPAPWMLAGILIALATYLLHNLIEFSFFETGPLYLFAMLAGSALGVRLSARDALAKVPAPSNSRVVPVAAFTVGALAWLAWGIFAFLPISLAEGASHDADTSARANRWDDAVNDLRYAMAKSPHNAEYAARAARYLLHKPGAAQDPAEVARAAELMDDAVAADPASPQNWVARAQIERLAPARYAEAIRRDYARAVRLDPANIRLRMEYALLLRDVAVKQKDAPTAEESMRQLRETLARNEQYHWDEIKRLNATERAEIAKAMEELSRIPSTPQHGSK